MYLSSTGRVLGSTSGDVARAELGDLLVDGEVLLLGKDGIVGLQFVLVKQSLGTTLDINLNGY